MLPLGARGHLEERSPERRVSRRPRKYPEAENSRHLPSHQESPSSVSSHHPSSLQPPTSFFLFPPSLRFLWRLTCGKKEGKQVRCTILDARGWCTGTTQRDGMGREEGSGWGTHVYLWRIHFDIWQNKYSYVKFKNKIKLKKKLKKKSSTIT